MLRPNRQSGNQPSIEFALLLIDIVGLKDIIPCMDETLAIRHCVTLFNEPVDRSGWATFYSDIETMSSSFC